MSAPVAKRARGGAARVKTFDWRVTIVTPQTFKTFLVIIYRVLSQCPFQLIKSDAFTGLRVDSMDSSMVCMIKASYECEVEANVDLSGESFCVVTDTFNTLLKDVQPGHVLTLTRYTDESDLTVESYSKEDTTNRSMCTLSILDEEMNVDRLRMQDITYEYMVEMDLARLKSYCKMAQELNSTHMEFTIEEPSEDEQATRNLFFTVGAQSDTATFRKIHHSQTATEPGSTSVKFAIRAVSCHDSTGEGGAQFDFESKRHLLEERYNEVYSTTYLNLVLKSMDRQSVQLFMSKGLPLVIRYSLGNDFSHVQVILAPRMRDE